MCALLQGRERKDTRKSLAMHQTTHVLLAAAKQGRTQYLISAWRALAFQVCFYMNANYEFRAKFVHVVIKECLVRLQGKSGHNEYQVTGRIGVN